MLFSISIISLILDNGYQVWPCFNIKCNNKGLLFIIHLILNLSLNGIITEPGKLITFQLNVTVTGHQSISIISHNVFLCKVTFSLFILPVNLNKSILPDVLHNLIGTYDLMSEMNIIILIVLE